MFRASKAALFLASSALTANAVTIYAIQSIDINGNPFRPTGTAQLPPPLVTMGAYNVTTLPAPPLPSPMPPLNLTAQLYSGGMNNLSRPQPGNFLGFSIELSVANQMREFH